MSSNLAAFTVTLVAGLALVDTQLLHGRFSLDGTIGVQKHHRLPTPRIGGVSVLLGLIIAWVLLTDEVNALFGPMLLASLPAFAFGLAEDLTKRVSVRARLLATMASGVLAWYLTGVAMQHTGVPLLDSLLGFTPLAVLFTAFAVGGVANAINIIDGFNGLACGAVAIMLGAIGLIALDVGDVPLATVCFVIASCALGFGVVNWPLGKMFLGDGGAYLLGFLLAWVAVLLPMRNPSVNAWATILVCAYPVLEVGFSVRRRRKRKGQAGQPDRAHLHHFLHRRVVCRTFPRLTPALQNGITAPLCWLVAAIPAIWAVAFAQNTPMLIVGFGLAVSGYAAMYARLTQFRWCLSARTLAPRDLPTPTLDPL